MRSIHPITTKGDTKDTVEGWFITRPETGEVLQHVTVSTNAPMLKGGIEFAGLAWHGALAWKWRKAGENVCPFFNRKGAVDIAKAFRLLTGEKVAVVKRSVA
jgi:hypothetical protein